MLSQGSIEHWCCTSLLKDEAHEDDWRTGCEDDRAVNRWLVHVHKVAVIPGSGCGFPGHIRVAFGKPEPALFKAAAVRLKQGISQLVAEGFEATVGRWLAANHEQ